MLCRVKQDGHPYISPGAGGNPSFSYMDLVDKVMSLFLSTLCLGLSQLFYLRVRVLYFHGCNHYPKWFWTPRTLSVAVSIFNLCICETRPLAFVRHHFVPRVQTCVLLHISLDFVFLHHSQLWWKGHLFWVLILENLGGFLKSIRVPW